MASMHDEENQKSALPFSQGRRYADEYKEASLLLAFWSILVMNEGVVRFVQFGQPGAPGLFEGTPVRFWAPFLGALFEVIFGSFGLAVGLAGGLLGIFNRGLLFALMVVQSGLGWYVFVDYVFLIPAYRIANEVPMLGMTAGGSRAVGVLGILTSLSWCLALQGGQFVWICRMMAFGGDKDFLKQRSGARMRAIFWNANYLIAGVWALVSAAIIISEVGSGTLPAGPFFAPPNVGRLPLYLLVIGAIMIVWPLIGISLSVAKKTGVMRKYVMASFLVFLAVHVHYTIGQLGFIAENPAPAAVPAAGAALHNHLAFMLTFLGPYFMLKQAQEEQSVHEDM